MAEHLDDHELTGLALGAEGPVPPRQRDHLDRCARCRGELRRLRQVVRAAREVSTEDVLTAPPEGVWRSIAAELELAGDAPGDRPAPGTGHRRDGRRALLLAAASLVAGAVLGAAATSWWPDDGVPPGAGTGAVRRLAPLTTGDAAGTVRLVHGPAVAVTVTDLPRTDGYYEVWLMDRSHTRLIALGVLGADGSATLHLPSGVDLAAYPLLDVSAQEDDGDPAHSGESVVRGTLPG
ncbi:MAG: anti-sigma factor [Streptomyces sp.]|nr:anti-sigma factor [Streptomyces sp.]